MEKGWNWTRPKSHSEQPLLHWYVEQIFVLTMLWLAKRAVDRNDTQTLKRLSRIIIAGAEAERMEKERQIFLEIAEKSGG